MPWLQEAEDHCKTAADVHANTHHIRKMRDLGLWVQRPNAPRFRLQPKDDPHLRKQLEPSRERTITSVLEFVCMHFHVEEHEMMLNERSPKVSNARTVAMYLIYKMIGCNYTALGKIFAGRGHQTCIETIQRVEKMLGGSPLEAVPIGVRMVSRNLVLAGFEVPCLIQ